MKTILKTDVPENVINCVEEMVRDFSMYLSMGKSKKQEKEKIQKVVSDLEKVLKADEWKINHFGVLVEYFYESKLTNQALASSSPMVREILRECDLLLKFCETHFRIEYFPDGTFMISQKIERVG